MNRCTIIVFFLLLTLQVSAQRKNDTFSVYFDLDAHVLNKNAQKTIDDLYASQQINKRAPIAIVGYADFLASEEYNLFLSQMRANNVRKYIGSLGINLDEIRVVIGKGEVKRTDTLGKDKGVAFDRRVEIVMEYEKVGEGGYVPKSERGDMTVIMRPKEKTVRPPSTTDKGFAIEDVPVGKSFILQKIYFPMGRHFPKNSSDEELRNLLRVLKENPTMEISIEGHVCCITQVADAYDLDSHQLDLSHNRARFVYEYLKARGIHESRLQYKGFGKSRPIYEKEETLEQASMNRRVEIRIMKK